MTKLRTMAELLLWVSAMIFQVSARINHFILNKYNLGKIYLQYEETEKIEVCRSLKLFKQIERKESEERVLGGLDEVVLG